MKNRFLVLASLAAVLFFSVPDAQAHDIFQDVLKEKYHLKSFSCKVCHPDSKDKKIRSMFAELVYQELKDKNLSEKWAEVEPKGDEAIEEFEKSIVDDFKKAMDVVGKKQFTVEDLMRHGLFYGARVDQDKIAELEGKTKE